MKSLPPIEWSHPATWPWMIYVWIALVLASFVKPAWTWLQKRRVASWPVTDGRISATEVTKPSSRWGWKQPVHLALFEYTYTVAGEEYTDTYERECATEELAEEFIRDLENRPVTVHVHPRVPRRSGLVESDVQNLLERRPPEPPGAQIAISLPFGYRLLVFFEALSAIGLFLSLCVHIGALMGRRPAPEFLFFGLHIGIFVVWFPSIFVAKRLVGNLQRKDLWKAVLKGAPDWMRYMFYGFGVYAMVNFALFMRNAPTGGDGGNIVPAEDWRGFSGHWMAFYSAALAILHSAVRLSRSAPRCPKGHSASPDDLYCPQCGMPIERRS